MRLGAKRVGLLSACVVLTACAQLLRREAVRDSRTAIEVAQKDCGWQRQSAKPSDTWQSSRHDALWHVWLTTSGDTTEPICCEYHGSAALDVWIRADTGKSAGCSVVKK